MTVASDAQAQLDLAGSLSAAVTAVSTLVTNTKTDGENSYWREVRAMLIRSSVTYNTDSIGGTASDTQMVTTTVGYPSPYNYWYYGPDRGTYG